MRDRYVTQQVQKKKKGHFWVDFGKRTKPTLQEIFRMLETDSNKEFGQIVEGLLYDLAKCDAKTREHILKEIFQRKIL